MCPQTGAKWRAHSALRALPGADMMWAPLREPQHPICQHCKTFEVPDRPAANARRQLAVTLLAVARDRGSDEGDP